MRYLGIDHGGKRIGLAIGDDETHIAAPLEVVEADSLDEAVGAVVLIIKEEGIDQIVLGLPTSMSGSNNKQADIVKRFGAALEQASGTKVNYEDERLSSKQADALTRDVAAANKDAIAAMVILQSYLDKLKMKK